MLIERQIARSLDASVLDEPASAARRAWYAFRKSHGLWPDAPLLTPPEANHKLGKNSVPTWSLSLAPALSSGAGNVCPASTPTCRAGCVAYAGRGRSAHKVRIVRALFLAEEPRAFVRFMAHELEVAARQGRVACRPNAFSDLAVERIAPWLLAALPGVMFMDYTKRWDRIGLGNYYLIYSASERTTVDQIRERVSTGANVAVVVGARRKEPLPATWAGLPALDGDRSDQRWTDPPGHVVLLRAKGSLYGRNGSLSGFVKPLAT